MDKKKQDIAAVFGGNLRRVRQELCLTQQELSKIIHINSNTISLWENGSVQPTYENINNLAECLGVDVTEFFISTDWYQRTEQNQLSSMEPVKNPYEMVLLIRRILQSDLPLNIESEWSTHCITIKETGYDKDVDRTGKIAPYIFSVLGRMCKNADMMKKFEHGTEEWEYAKEDDQMDLNEIVYFYRCANSSELSFN